MWRARALPAVPACREPSWCRSFTRVQASFNAKLVLLRLLRSLARSMALHHIRCTSEAADSVPLSCLSPFHRLLLLTGRASLTLGPCLALQLEGAM